MNKTQFNQLVVGDVVKDFYGKLHTIESVERFSKSPSLKETYSFTDTTKMRCIENDADVADLTLVDVNFSIAMQELLPDFGSYIHDIEWTTGHQIKSGEMIDMLMDFAKWDNLQLVELKNIQWHAKKLAEHYCPKGK
jgi:hypothetical protein